MSIQPKRYYPLEKEMAEWTGIRFAGNLHK